nr:BRO family protein [Gluconobacter wancherniae]
MGETLVTEITLFRFDNISLRAVTDGDGTPWFMATDVCEALQVTNPTVSVKALDEDERSKFNLGRGVEANFVNESGLYTLTLRCRDAMKVGTRPHRFRKWITSEVIPSIRKTGGYSIQLPQQTLSREQKINEAFLLSQDIIREKDEEIAVLRPQAEAFQIIGEAEGELGVRDVGREVKLGQAWVTETLLARKWACKQGGKLRPAHYGLEHDYVCLRASSYKCGITGETKVRDDFKVTRKGINRLAQIIANIRAATQASASREMEMH